MGLKENLTGSGTDWEHERASKRAALAIPVQLKLGTAAPEPRRLRDVSLAGVYVHGAHNDSTVGEPAILRFEGYPDVCSPFALFGHVLRLEPTGLAIEIDRQGSDAEAIEQYRKLVLYYLRHRPLLDELAPRFYEGRCEACGWIGRVAGESPACARCGEKVTPIKPAGQ